jgi:hypothetical protein
MDTGSGEHGRIEADQFVSGWIVGDSLGSGLRREGVSLHLNGERHHQGACQLARRAIYVHLSQVSNRYRLNFLMILRRESPGCPSSV